MIAIVLPWFFNHGYLFCTDMAWGPNTSLSNWTGNRFLLDFFIKILSFALSVDFIQKIFITLVFFVILLGAKKIVEQLTNNKGFIFIISLFALFNPLIYDRAMYGQFSIILAFAFLCFSVGYLLEYLKKRKTKQILLAGLFAGLMIQFSLHFIFLGGIFYLLFVLIWLKEKLGAKTIVKNLFFIVAIIIVVNCNVFLGVVLNNSRTANFVQNTIV